jgi:hypothetical protein
MKTRLAKRDSTRHYSLATVVETNTRREKEYILCGAKYPPSMFFACTYVRTYADTPIEYELCTYITRILLDSYICTERPRGRDTNVTVFPEEKTYARDLGVEINVYQTTGWIHHLHPPTERDEDRVCKSNRHSIKISTLKLDHAYPSCNDPLFGVYCESLSACICAQNFF